LYNISLSIYYKHIYYYYCLLNLEIVDIGQPCMEFQYCHAKLWYKQRADKSKRGNQVEFSICCGRAKGTTSIITKTSTIAYKFT